MLVAWNHTAVMRLSYSGREKVNSTQSIAKFIIIYEALDYDYFEALQHRKKQRQQLYKSKIESAANKFDQQNKIKNENDNEYNGFIESAKSIEVDVKSTEILLIDLEPDTEYKVLVIAVDYAGRRSLPSRPRVARTYGNCLF